MVKDEKFTKCRAVIDEDLMVKNGDKNFFAFIGENAIYSLARSIYPADVQRIEDAIKELEREKINIIKIFFFFIFYLFFFFFYCIYFFVCLFFLY